MKLIRREAYLDFLRGHRKTDAIKVVSGVRRCGKSTLFRLYKDELLEEGIAPEQIISVNFEDLAYESLRDYRDLYRYITERLLENREMFVFLDEIQYVPMFEKVVDSLFIKDQVQVYITGSNAYFMSSELSTLLAGRYVELRMLPFSFAEFVEAYESEVPLTHRALYERYTQYGAFPGAMPLFEEPQLLRDYVQGIFNTIMMKDVITRMKITDVELLESISRYLFANIGSLLNPTKIANTLTSFGRKIDSRTVERYINGLKDGLLLYQSDRFDVCGKAVLQVNAKYYVVDVGLKQFLLPERGEDTGHILENVVYLELIRRGYKVYVGHLAKGEIDFVAQKPGIIEYYQVSQTVLDPTTLERELAPLCSISDHHPKYLLTFDEINANASYDGILQHNVLDWLLER